MPVFFEARNAIQYDTGFQERLPWPKNYAHQTYIEALSSPGLSFRMSITTTAKAMRKTQNIVSWP